MCLVPSEAGFLRPLFFYNRPHSIFYLAHSEGTEWCSQYTFTLFLFVVTSARGMALNKF